MLFLDPVETGSAPEETFIWVVTKSDLRWVRSDLGVKGLIGEVQALRCGLDGSAWDDKPCEKLTGKTYTDADRDAAGPLPFDYERAYKLYEALFGQVEDLIKGKQLLIVPVRAAHAIAVPGAGDGGAPEDERGKRGLADPRSRPHHTARGFLAQGAQARGAAQRGKKPMIGFGNPLLDAHFLLNGVPAHDAAIKARVKSAAENQRCRDAPWQRLAALIGWHRGLAPVEIQSGLADVEFLRGQDPLPETAKELCEVAHDLGADSGGIRLGARATEREVKHLSETGQLAQYRVVHFATHGALAGEVRGNAEPGLLLTPPQEPSEEEDGYLTASEIAGLKLDADWVILSACNTAAGGAQGAEALSGLARAFIYAQARALLVSHWEVNSEATVKLITGAMHRLAADRGHWPRGGDAPVDAFAHR